MAEAKLQERLPLAAFRDLDGHGAILLRGFQRYRAHYDPRNSWPVPMSTFIHAGKPEVQVPLLAADIATEAPEGSLLSNPTTVQNLLNALSFTQTGGYVYGAIPYVPVDNRGEVW